jgi:hypothetical protein
VNEFSVTQYILGFIAEEVPEGFNYLIVGDALM